MNEFHVINAKDDADNFRRFVLITVTIALVFAGAIVAWTLKKSQTETNLYKARAELKLQKATEEKIPLEHVQLPQNRPLHQSPQTEYYKPEPH